MRVDSDSKIVLEKHFDVINAKVVISSFEPASLPAVRVVDQDALLKQRIESDELERSVGSATLMLARSFTDKLEIEHEAYLYLNANNTLIKNFASLQPDKQSSLAATIIAITNLLSGDNQGSGTDDTDSLLENLTSSLESLAGQGELQ